MNSFVKLFEHILGSSVWAEDDKTLRVWITFLVMKNAKHIVRGSPVGIAHLARVSVEECRRAIQKFESPDPDSTSQEYEGRRIQKVPEGGWLVLNGAKYAAMLSKQDRLEYNRQKMAECRARKAALNSGQPLPGEERYLDAEANGAPDEALSKIVTDHLPAQ